MGKPYQRQDAYFRKAKQEGLRARSAFKVEGILRRFSLVRAGDRVLDLGAAPGGFLQILADIVGPDGYVLGIDVVAIRPLPQAQVQTAVLDVLGDDFVARLDAVTRDPFHLVVSDLAPKTTGIKTTDEARSIALAQTALATGRTRGRRGGHFVAKLFMGGDFEGFRAEVRREYGDVKIVRPEATRSASKEVYVVGLKKRP